MIDRRENEGQVIAKATVRDLDDLMAQLEEDGVKTMDKEGILDDLRNGVVSILTNQFCSGLRIDLSNFQPMSEEVLIK